MEENYKKKLLNYIINTEDCNTYDIGIITDKYKNYFNQYNLNNYDIDYDIEDYIYLLHIIKNEKYTVNDFKVDDMYTLLMFGKVQIFRYIVDDLGYNLNDCDKHKLLFYFVKYMNSYDQISYINYNYDDTLFEYIVDKANITKEDISYNDYEFIQKLFYDTYYNHKIKENIGDIILYIFKNLI